MAAQEVVCKGVRWRVGYGQKIQIWDEKQLPNSSLYKVISPKSPNPLVSLVSDLIDINDKRWNIDLLQQVFLPFEANYIGGIPFKYEVA